MRVQLWWFGAWQSAWMHYDHIYSDGAMVEVDSDGPYRFYPWSHIQMGHAV